MIMESEYMKNRNNQLVMKGKIKMKAKGVYTKKQLSDMLGIRWCS